MTAKKKPAKKAVKKAAKKPAAPSSPRKILTESDPPPYQLVNPRGEGRGLVICDHASNRVPRVLKGLGIQKSDLMRHIGWDIGTEDIGRHISRALDMPLVLASYSRLVVDLNRAPNHKECIPEVSDRTAIPANEGLSAKDKEKRLKEIFHPYQAQIEKQVARLSRKGAPFLLSIHSYTPIMGAEKRPWHIAILWNRQEKVAKQLIAEIRRQHPEYLVGSNEPYSLKDERFVNSTMYRHAEKRNLPYIFVEFRQDLVDTKEKAAEWAEIFLAALKPVLSDLGYV